MTTRTQVALWTLGLSALATLLSMALVAVQYWLWGVESADLPTMAGMTVLTVAVVAPSFLGPLVWLAIRHQELSARLRQVSLTDALTGIPNRRAFFEHASPRLGTEAEPMAFAVLVIDADRFKAINDRLGHEAGDAALVFIAARLNHTLARLRIEDVFLARLGGEEFAAFLPQATEPVAGRVAEALCADLRAADFRHRGRAVALTISVGVWAGRSEAGLELALALADKATYAAKAQGRDRWAAADADAVEAEGWHQAEAAPFPCRGAA